MSLIQPARIWIGHYTTTAMLPGVVAPQSDLQINDLASVGGALYVCVNPTHPATWISGAGSVSADTTTYDDGVSPVYGSGTVQGALDVIKNLIFVLNTGARLPDPPTLIVGNHDVSGLPPWVKVNDSGGDVHFHNIDLVPASMAFAVLEIIGGHNIIIDCPTGWTTPSGLNQAFFMISGPRWVIFIDKPGMLIDVNPAS